MPRGPPQGSDTMKTPPTLRLLLSQPAPAANANFFLPSEPEQSRAPVASSPPLLCLPQTTERGRLRPPPPQRSSRRTKRQVVEDLPSPQPTGTAKCHFPGDRCPLKQTFHPTS